MGDLPSNKIRDIRGEVFGRLTVVSFSHVAPDNGKNAYWNCSCTCGGSNAVSSSALRAGSTISCGCYRTELNKILIKKTHNKGQHLYFIRSGEYVKIGRADKPWLRLGQIRASNPFGAEMIEIVENEGYREKEYHEYYKDKLHTGEWFLDPHGEVITIGSVNDG
jgi:hypothetical protein